MITDVQYEETGDALDLVSLETAKKHLRLESDFDEEDGLITGYIRAAVSNSANFIGGAILLKDMVMKMDAFENPLVFEAFPLMSVASVFYYPADDTAQVELVEDDDWVLTRQNDKVFALRFKGDLPALADRFDAVIVTVVVGMENVPAPIVQAVLLQVAGMYEYREDRTEVVGTAAMSLLRAYKKY